MVTADEIRGDSSNFKGTHYHLVYALWLLLRNEAANVYFYEGNDLLARFALPSPIAPPDPTSLLDTDEDPAIALYAERGTNDIWIQLKSTKTIWSCSRLLDKNLLINVICNGFQSEARAGPIRPESEREAKVRLKSFLYDARGWFEAGFYELRHNLLLQGTSYMRYFLPAVRLLLVGAAAQFGIKDPAGTLMRERSETTKIINAHSYLLREERIDEKDMRHATHALAELQKRELLTPDDERLPDTIGGFLLAMNRLREAETAFKRSLSKPLSRGGMRAHTLKNLALTLSAAR